MLHAMINLVEKATKYALDLGHKLDPARWTTSQRGQSNHCLKCGRFVGVIYAPEEVYGAALNASCEEEVSNPLSEASTLEDILLTKHLDLVDRFLEIAERKVSVLDEYGDENTDALKEEIDKCLGKLAKREPSLDLSKWSMRDQPNALAGTYRDESAIRLSQSLQLKFDAYHKGRKTASNVVQDFSKLTGVEFECHVANRLK